MHSGGGGGGGGQVMRSSVRVTPGEEIQCTIGQGGSSGYGTGVYTGLNGESGSATQFSTLSVNGGEMEEKVRTGLTLL